MSILVQSPIHVEHRCAKERDDNGTVYGWGMWAAFEGPTRAINHIEFCPWCGEHLPDTGEIARLAAEAKERVTAE